MNLPIPTIEIPEALLAATEALEEREAAVRAAETAVAAAREGVPVADRRDVAEIAAARDSGAKRDPKPEHEQEALAVLDAAEHEAEIAGARRDQVAAEYERVAVKERPPLKVRSLLNRRMNRTPTWLIWAATALIAIWLLLYAVGYRLGEVGN